MKKRPPNWVTEVCRFRLGFALSMMRRPKATAEAPGLPRVATLGSSAVHLTSASDSVHDLDKKDVIFGGLHRGIYPDIPPSLPSLTVQRKQYRWQVSEPQSIRPGNRIEQPREVYSAARLPSPVCCTRENLATPLGVRQTQCICHTILYQLSSSNACLRLVVDATACCSPFRFGEPAPYSRRKPSGSCEERVLAFPKGIVGRASW